jgi:hypothetical protein
MTLFATPVAAALAALAERPDDTTVRLAFFEALAEAELVLWLADEAGPEVLEPRVFPVDQGPVVLAFDCEAALAEFAGPAAAYAALPGRALVALLAGRGLGLMLQAAGGLAEHMPQRSVAWLARQLEAPAPQPFVPPLVLGYDPPQQVPPVLVLAIERRLAGVPGLSAAILATARWAGGAEGLVLALAGVPPAAQAPLARSLIEAVAFAGIDAPAPDIVFPDPVALVRIEAVGMALRLPQLLRHEPEARPVGPGLDPARPPRLR